MLIIHQRLFDRDSILVPFTGDRVAVILVVAWDDDRLPEVTGAPVEEGVVLDPPLLKVADVSRQQQDVATFHKSVDLHIPGVHPELQVQVRCILYLHIVSLFCGTYPLGRS